MPGHTVQKGVVDTGLNPLINKIIVIRILPSRTVNINYYHYHEIKKIGTEV